MMKRWFVVLMALPIGLIVLMNGASAQTTPTPYMTTVGVMVDSINSDTSSVINCFTEGSNGRFNTVNGDATLIMANRTPHTIICTINIKKN